MAEIVLHHCQPVPLCGPFDPPIPVALGFTIGGQDGDGSVDVSAPELPVPSTFPTNSFGFLRFPAVSSLIVHYRKSADGPDEIPVTVDTTPT